MKKVIKFSSALLFSLPLFFTSCKKNELASKQDEISQDVLNQITAMGFNAEGVQKYNGGYLVEGDIFLNDDNLKSKPSSPNMIIASEEQYHTFNLVTALPRTITVSINTTAAYFVNALDTAINRFNRENLRLTFQRVSGPADINLVTFYEVSNTIGSGGFPSGGNPYNQIRLNTYYFTPSSNVRYLGTVIAHEIGHCIGFRHTDYMNRAYSCGGRKYNEEKPFASGYGAVYIPGTPTGPDPNSWMLACIGTGVSRDFNANDKVALNYVY
jgi:Dual-action HEIGH metallo-peptidase